MKVTILYDERVSSKPVKKGGFSCFVEAHGKKILFDTGYNEEVIKLGMAKHNINQKLIDIIFISHNHWDHRDGLHAFRDFKGLVYVPQALDEPFNTLNSKIVTGKEEICTGFWSTGTLKSSKGTLEHSLVLETKHGLIVFVGCAHPGVDEILEKAGTIESDLSDKGVKGLIGGLHGYSCYKVSPLFKKLDLICPTHCSGVEHIKNIEKLYKRKFKQGKTGQEIYIDQHFDNLSGSS